ncbi:MAG TPA: hypothetical protein VEV19_12965 [Ktedonobacteraceae bacterium]|nr:hypothetical protein [Ktedonobacteraceae bacterium]
MNNAQIYMGALVLGVIALILGVLFYLGVFGTHHTLVYAAFGVGVVLVIIGVAGMVMRNRAG